MSKDIKLPQRRGLPPFPEWAEPHLVTFGAIPVDPRSDDDVEDVLRDLERDS
jgi:hypothetical protein